MLPTGFLLGIFFQGGQNLLLCKFPQSCYFYIILDQFLGGESFRGGDKLLQGEPPWKKPVLNALIYTSSGYGFFRGFQLMFLKHADVLNPRNLNEGN